MLRSLGRIALQLVLSGPLVIFYPFLLYGTAMTLQTLVVAGPEAAANGTIVVAGGVGLTGLYASILLPLAWLRGKRWLRWSVTAFMAVGVLLSATFSWVEFGYGKPTDNPLWSLWVFGGPLVVAVWNLWRMYAKTRTEEAR